MNLILSPTPAQAAFNRANRCSEREISTVVTEETFAASALRKRPLPVPISSTAPERGRA